MEDRNFEKSLNPVFHPAFLVITDVALRVGTATYVALGQRFAGNKPPGTGEQI
jgi:hypothetical protein